MTENANLILQKLQHDTYKLIDLLEKEKDHNELDTIKISLLDKWRFAYNELNKETSNTEFDVSLPSHKKTKKLAGILVAQHLLKNHDSEIASLIPDLDNTIEDFNMLKNIEHGIKIKDLLPLQDLFCDERFKFGKLEFLYHVMAFLLILNENGSKHAILYAKKNFNANDCKEDIRSLLKLAIDPSKYKNYLHTYTKLLKKQLHIDFALIKSLPQFNVLKVLFKGGTDSLANLVKASDVFEQYKINYHEGGELPIDLEVSAKYHSLFICPVLKIYCGEDNPPVRLKCGHVISFVAVERISKDNVLSVFKCPYCPNDSKMTEIKELKL
ncbi:hypothetical protein COBT_000200 [Conglomerata obtusa]